MPQARRSDLASLYLLPDFAARNWAVAAASTLGAALPFQQTLALAGNEVRVSLADLAGLLLAPLLATALWHGRDMLRRLPRALPLLAAGATAAFGGALAIAALSPGGATVWALVKFSGWFILLGYAAAGAIIASADPARAPRAFILAFAGTVALITAAHVATSAAGHPWETIYVGRLKGFSGNANAFGLVAVCAAAMVLACIEDLTLHGRALPAEILCSVPCTGAIYSGSVAVFGGLIAVALIYVLRGNSLARMARITIIGCVIYALPPLLAPESNRDFGVLTKGAALVFGDRYGGKWTLDNYARRIKESSLTTRVESNRQAVQLWRERPLFGIGLGRFLAIRAADASSGKTVMIIHSVPLWLLTETGIAGLALITGLFAALGHFLLCAERRLRQTGPPRARFIEAGLMALAAWAVVSLVHESMYQRAPWLILGLCIGLALAPPRKEQAARR